ncbi:hypothetical protein ABEW03_19415, partial [Virgibacillus pantothenticus]|uniref:hypothetical protein n=1 Tax=Virgibacillus pantothenticus TaxID=1473 RepID=UPI003D296C92
RTDDDLSEGAFLKSHRCWRLRRTWLVGYFVILKHLILYFLSLNIKLVILLPFFATPKEQEYAALCKMK